MSDDRFPWNNHPTSPEARAINQRADSAAAAERLRKSNPMRMRDYLIVAGGAVALIGIPLILISFFL